MIMLHKQSVQFIRVKCTAELCFHRGLLHKNTYQVGISLELKLTSAQRNIFNISLYCFYE